MQKRMCILLVDNNRNCSRAKVARKRVHVHVRLDLPRAHIGERLGDKT